MSLRSHIAGARRRTLTVIGRRRARIAYDRPLVSFSFDDFPRSAVETAGVILRDAGVNGTYYAAPALMGTENHLGPLFLEEDLAAVLTAGHELASHTYSHVSARDLAPGDYASEVEKGFQWLSERFGKSVSRQFSYPYGDITLRIKQTIGPKMDACRGIWPGLNGPDLDLNLLRANSLYGDSARTAAKSLIDQNCREGSWLIFYTHDVRPDPSDYGCTPALLNDVVHLAISSGARIATVADVIALTRPV